MFPFLNQKMDFSKEKEAHTVIHGCLGQLLALIHGARSEPTRCGCRHGCKRFRGVSDVCGIARFLRGGSVEKVGGGVE